MSADAKSTQSHPARRLSKPRFAGFIFMAVYPLVTILLYGVIEWTPQWDLWKRTLVLCPFIVISMVWFIIPAIQKYLGRLITVPVK